VKRESIAESARQPTSRGAELVWLLLPALVAVVLALPCFRFTYLFDDYLFFHRVQPFHPAVLLPDPQSIFYRPLSREIYFGLLSILSPSSAALGHFLNLLILAVVVILLARFARGLAGPRAGFFAALVFASLGALPILVGWISGVQDLLAMTFILGALNLQLSNRTGLACVSFALAMLSKETAIAALPALVGLDWILGRRPYGILRRAAVYGAVALVWALLHPGIRILIQRGFSSGGAGYVGLDNPDRCVALWNGFLTLLNVPPTLAGISWPRGGTLSLVGAAVLLVVAILLRSRFDARDTGAGTISGPRILLLSATLAAPPLLLTSALVRHWSPYYLCIPALGVAVGLGYALSRMRVGWAFGALGLFLCLGLWSRGIDIDPEIPTERNFDLPSGALRRLEAEFKGLKPSLAPRAQVLVTILAQGRRSIHVHMYNFQAMRQWYRDPELWTIRPERRKPHPPAEYLFWITPKLEVFEVDLRTLQTRTNGPRPDYFDYQKTVKFYARGLAATGSTDLAVKILLGMPQLVPQFRDVDHRIAAMLLFTAGDSVRARQILAPLPPLDRTTALGLVTAFLSTPDRRQAKDEAVMEAFGIPRDDPESIRTLMVSCNKPGAYPVSLRFAHRLLVLRPDDAEAHRVIAAIEALPKVDLVISATPGDSL
jgi:hypothetical protein